MPFLFSLSLMFVYVFSKSLFLSVFSEKSLPTSFMLTRFVVFKFASFAHLVSLSSLGKTVKNISLSLSLAFSMILRMRVARWFFGWEHCCALLFFESHSTPPSLFFFFFFFFLSLVFFGSGVCCSVVKALSSFLSQCLSLPLTLSLDQSISLFSLPMLSLAVTTRQARATCPKGYLFGGL